MQAKIYLFALLLLVSAVLVQGVQDPRCGGTPLSHFRGDASDHKWTFKDGGCTLEGLTGYGETTTNMFDSEAECTSLCLG
uniref:Putative conserved secreted protein n=1 Tax=Ornithodoros turicata TaxID=34597 RepID=A0A2R5LBI6_9ACAR